MRRVFDEAMAFRVFPAGAMLNHRQQGAKEPVKVGDSAGGKMDFGSFFNEQIRRLTESATK